MAGITQTIPNYAGGISEQPDLLKNPGQVRNIQNGIPDVTYGLYKRPGSKRIGTTIIPNVRSGGSWFHYYRDETEGSYIGQIASGRVRVWSCKDGTEKNVWYHTDDSAYSTSNADHTSIVSYLTTANTESIQALTINDTTFLSNRDKVVGTTGTTDAKPHTYAAYIELLRTENGRQYGMNISTPSAVADDVIKTATRVKIKSDTLDEGPGTAKCPGIGTQVFSGNETDTGSRKNLTFRITTLGQIGQETTGSTVDSYSCTYNRDLVLLHGGEDWEDGDETTVTMDSSVGISNEITSIPISSGGAGYTGNTIIITVTGGDGTGFSGTANINASGAVDAVTIIDGGKNYTGTPTVTFGIPWAQNTAYTIGDQVIADGKVYTCDTNGTSDSSGTGPSGTGSNISDNTTRWDYAGAAAVAGTVVKSGVTNVSYTIEVTEHEENKVKADVKAVRPTPTPFDNDTAVTSDIVLGGILAELTGVTVDGNALSATIIGNGIYLSCAAAFNIEIYEPDLMRVMQDSINDVTDLPNQCKHGYIVKVANARMSDEDDYYLKFEGTNSGDGSGSWIECAAPGIVKSLDNTTMPHVLQRQADGDFLVKAFTYADRTVGDDVTNPLPSFADGSSKINKVLFFRNRLAFLSGENVVLCKPGTLGTPDFFAETALTVSSVDPIDIACSSTFPSSLFDGLEINTGLVLFSSNQQFLLSSDDTVLNPDTAKLRNVAAYNYNTVIPPISLGTTIGYIDNSGKFSRFNEMANVAREGEPIVSEISKLAPSLLPKDIDLITNSRENQMIFFGKTDSDIVYGLRYFRTGERQVQTAWFKWKLNNPLKYHFIIDDVYYYLDADNFLQSINLIQSDDPSFVKDSNTFIIHIDNFVTISGGVYDEPTDITTFTGVTWLPSVTSPNGSLIVIDISTDSVRVARHAEPTITSSTSFTLSGDWSGSGDIYIGYLYDYQVDLPRIYPTQTQGEISKKDTNASLVLHRAQINFGKIGLYETTLTRVGKDDYTEIHESSISDEYDISDIPYLVEETRTIPIYERNTNVNITLKSTHPAPCTLHSMSWEGDYSPRYYKRV